jgi:hypothetical protein
VQHACTGLTGPPPAAPPRPPSQVPLGGRLGQTIEPLCQFTPEMACVMAHEKLSAFAAAKQAQMVSAARCMLHAARCTLHAARCRARSRGARRTAACGHVAGGRLLESNGSQCMAAADPPPPPRSSSLPPPQNGTWIPPWASGRWDPQQRGPFAPQLAILIDLTNSSRYYSPIEVPAGMSYIKVGWGVGGWYGGAEAPAAGVGAYGERVCFDHPLHAPAPPRRPPPPLRRCRAWGATRRQTPWRSTRWHGRSTRR